MRGSLEDRQVRPQRLVGRPPSQGGGEAVPAKECERLRLSHVAASSRDSRRLELVRLEHLRLVQVDDLRRVRQLDRRESERQPTSNEHRGPETAASKVGELLDDGRDLSLGDVQTAVDLGVVVAPVALKSARKPQRASRLARYFAARPGEAAMDDQANESARSLRIARISSSVRPARIRSIGRRSPRCGFRPSSHSRAASGS